MLRVRGLLSDTKGYACFSAMMLGSGDAGSGSSGAGGGVVAIVHPIHAAMPSIPATAMNAVICKTRIVKA
jgi:hypothetical protein